MFFILNDDHVFIIFPLRYFLEQRMLSFFVRYVKQPRQSSSQNVSLTHSRALGGGVAPDAEPVALIAGRKQLSVQLLQTLGILVENIRQSAFNYYLLSNDYLNAILAHKFDFDDEEVFTLVISLLNQQTHAASHAILIYSSDHPAYSIQIHLHFFHTLCSKYLT